MLSGSRLGNPITLLRFSKSSLDLSEVKSPHSSMAIMLSAYTAKTINKNTKTIFVIVSLLLVDRIDDVIIITSDQSTLGPYLFKSHLKIMVNGKMIAVRMSPRAESTGNESKFARGATSADSIA